MTRSSTGGLRRTHGSVRLVYVLAALCGLLPGCAAAQDQAADFETAARAASRLSPTAFSGLPAPVAAALVEARCAIPQYRFDGDSLANNLLPGQFAAAGQLDYAALCSRDGHTALIVIWGGPSHCASNTKDAADVDAMTGAGEGVFFSRRIESLTPQRARDFVWLAGAGLQQLDHDGIVHSSGEYQTSILYCRRGEWIEIEPDATT
jgi:hypothetical protein